MDMLTQRASGITELGQLNCKVIGVGDMAAPDKNFLGILLCQQAINPGRDVARQHTGSDRFARRVTANAAT